MKEEKRLMNMKIPVLRPFHLKVLTQEDGTRCVYYGITDIMMRTWALEAIDKYVKEHSLGECVAAFDFKNDTKIKNKRWFIEDELNVYENTKCSDASTLLYGNTEEYERMYMFIESRASLLDKITQTEAKF